MSVRLACSLSSRIAAVAPVAGSYYPPFSSPPVSTDTCPDTWPIPFLTFHGTADTCVPWSGGPGCGGFSFRLPIDIAMPGDDVMQEWAAHHGCTGGRHESQVTTNVRLVQYTNCNEGAPLQLYAVDGGGHTWPGSPVNLPGTTYEISATDLMWQFFQAHPLSVLDTDQDGCTDVREQQGSPGSETSGGRRDPNYFWDFYDVWTRPDPIGQPSMWVRDKAVTIPGDVLGVAHRFGSTRPGGPPTKTQALAEAFVPPTSPDGYHADYDRGPLIGPNAWDLGPPDGAIDIPNDILGVARQFGTNCN